MGVVLSNLESWARSEAPSAHAWGLGRSLSALKRTVFAADCSCAPVENSENTEKVSGEGEAGEPTPAPPTFRPRSPGLFLAVACFAVPLRFKGNLPSCFPLSVLSKARIFCWAWRFESFPLPHGYCPRPPGPTRGLWRDW